MTRQNGGRKEPAPLYEERACFQTVGKTSNEVMVEVRCPDCQEHAEAPCETCSGTGRYVEKYPNAGNHQGINVIPLVDAIRLESQKEFGNLYTGFEVLARLEGDSSPFFADIATLTKESFIALGMRDPVTMIQLALQLLGYNRGKS